MISNDGWSKDIESRGVENGWLLLKCLKIWTPRQCFVHSERPGDGEGDMDVSPDDTGGGCAAGFDETNLGKVHKVWEKYKVSYGKSCLNMLEENMFCTFSQESRWIGPLGWVWSHIWEISCEGVITGAPNNAEHMLQIVTAYACLVYSFATGRSGSAVAMVQMVMPGCSRSRKRRW